MRTYEKQWFKLGVITYVVTLFLLVILPGILVGIWTLGEEPSGSIDSDKVSVTVWRTVSKTVDIIPLEEYVSGVVASEMPSNFDFEALKAQAVAARTYGLAKMEKSKSGNPQAHPKAPLCDGTHCQAYRSDKISDKVREAVLETKGQVMYYQGEMIDQPLFHSASGERTENSEDVFSAAVPYLRSVESGKYENGAYAAETYAIGLDALVKKVRTVAGGASAEPVAVVSRSEGGRVEQFQVGGATVTGRQIRELLGLRSANFTVQMITDSSGGRQVLFTTSGNGHGVGMSQYGADGMGKAGFDYKEILQHYYSGV
ncbi:MAG: stage II sporulation protein D, partial [Firmicutes bacterium]|nr:stage II sporulation protein D [Bacillota bacterium]